MEQNSLGSSITRSVENELDKMNTVSMNISYSNLIKDMFRDYEKLSNPGDYPDSKVRKYNDQSLLFDSILGIMGPFNNVSQVYLYTMEGFMVGSGLFNEETVVDLESADKLQKAIELDGYKYITSPAKSEILARRNMHLKDHSFISLVRVFKDQHHQNEGIVEVQQDCEKLFSSIENQKKDKDHFRAFIINSDNRLLYPYNNEDSLSSRELNSIITLGSDVENQLSLNEDSNGNIISIFNIDEYGLKLVFLQSKYYILAPVRNFRFVFFIFIGIILIYTIIVSYSVSSRVTQPLNRLVNSLSSLKLNNLSLDRIDKFRPVDKRVEEIDTLYNAFIKMFNKLQTSLNELIALKDQEALTRLLTLQSQMNPHFLYNNLSIISILAEEKKNSQVVSMCKDISDMLRYSNEKSPGGASLEDEIEYVKKYLTCMIARYEDDLEYSIDIDPFMNSIRIPRILIQPLVENSINHGFNSDPPWNISIRGKIVRGRWFITVSDNGVGFSSELIDKFRSGLGKRSLKSENIGLENTRQRLELIYKNNAVFSISNNRDGGATVTIGGNVNYYEDRYEG